jgi:glycosyltransferase involved in cell wall biosynthesis
MKKNIAFLCSTLRRTGPTRQLFFIIKYLDRDRFSPFVFTLSPEEHDSMISDFAELGIDVECLHIRRFKSLMSSSNLLEEKAKDLKIDLIHSQGIRADGIVSKIRDRQLHLATMRNDPKVDYSMKFGFVVGYLMAFRHIMLLKMLRVATCSRHLQSRLMTYGINSSCVENGVEDPYDSAVVRRSVRQNVREHLEVGKDSLVGIVVGSLIKRKNISCIIKGFNKLSVDSSVTLLIVGDGKMRVDLEALKLGDRDIRFLGPSSQIKELLEGADFFISASLSEGLPNAALEAIAAGLPCLLSDIPPHAELANQTGLVRLTSISDQNLFDQSFFQFVNAIKIDLDSRYLFSVPSLFKARVMSKKYQDMYRQILEKQ